MTSGFTSSWKALPPGLWPIIDVLSARLTLFWRTSVSRGLRTSRLTFFHQRAESENIDTARAWSFSRLKGFSAFVRSQALSRLRARVAIIELCWMEQNRGTFFVGLFVWNRLFSQPRILWLKSATSEKYQRKLIDINFKIITIKKVFLFPNHLS